MYGYTRFSAHVLFHLRPCCRCRLFPGFLRCCFFPSITLLSVLLAPVLSFSFSFCSIVFVYLLLLVVFVSVSFVVAVFIPILHPFFVILLLFFLFSVVGVFVLVTLDASAVQPQRGMDARFSNQIEYRTFSSSSICLIQKLCPYRHNNEDTGDMPASPLLMNRVVLFSV